MKNEMASEKVTTDELAQKILAEVQSCLIKLKSEFQKNDKEELMTRSEVCDFLKIDSSTLWSWTKQKKVISYGIANRRYYKKSEILQSLTTLNK